MLLSSVALSSCGPAITTGDRLSDFVVAREGGLSTPCVTLTDRTVIYASDDEGPPGMLRPRSFKNARVRAAAERLEMSWKEVPEQSFQTFGTAEGDRCLMVVGRSTISGGIAFVEFSAPSGQIGAYAFRRGGGQWFVVERVVLGFW
jgi:hypothetical protein